MSNERSPSVSSVPPVVSPLAEWLIQHGIDGDRLEHVLKALKDDDIAYTIEDLSECWEDVKAKIHVGPQMAVGKALKQWRSVAPPPESRRDSLQSHQPIVTSVTISYGARHETLRFAQQPAEHGSESVRTIQMRLARDAAHIFGGPIVVSAWRQGCSRGVAQPFTLVGSSGHRQRASFDSSCTWYTHTSRSLAANPIRSFTVCLAAGNPLHAERIDEPAKMSESPLSSTQKRSSHTIATLV